MSYGIKMPESHFFLTFAFYIYLAIYVFESQTKD